MHRQRLMPLLGTAVAAALPPATARRSRQQPLPPEQRQGQSNLSVTQTAVCLGSGSRSLRCAEAKEAAKPVPPPFEPGDRAFTLKDLHGHRGATEGLPILTSLLGRVYDVSAAADLFGPGGPYAQWAGHDCTLSLALMSFEEHLVDCFVYELDEAGKRTLGQWVAYFDNKYGQPLGRLCDCKHPVALGDLPRPARIPFSN